MKGWPSGFSSYRPGQEEAVEEVLEAYGDGARTVMLDGPTGTGKTIVANGVRLGLGVKTLYSCHQLALQDQVERDFPFAAVLKGRSRYPVPGRPGVTAADCDWTRETGCSWERWCGGKTRCPREVAKRELMQAQLGVVNHALLVTERRFVGLLSAPLTVIDEVDRMEEVLIDQTSVVLGQWLRKKLRIGKPRFVSKQESVRAWLEDEVVPAVASELARWPRLSDDLRERRQRAEWEDRLARVRWVAEHFDEGWVFDHGGERWELKPLWAIRWGKKWLDLPMVLGMSATLISGREMAEALGLAEPVRVIRVEAGFPVENRPIKVAPVTDMRTSRKDEDGDRRLADAVQAIMAANPGVRILVHTHTFRTAEMLAEALDDPRTVLYERGAENKAKAEAHYRATPGAVMLAPSMERGYSFDDDLCRVQVVCKVPFPYAKDAQVMGRIYQHPRGQQAGWINYHLETIRALVQMTGRAVRHPEDWAETWILDAAFVDLRRRYGRFFPRWWAQALTTEVDMRRLRKERTA